MAWWNVSKKKKKSAPTPKATPTIQYSAPIGPTQPSLQDPTGRLPSTSLISYSGGGGSSSGGGGGGSSGGGGGGSVTIPKKVVVSEAVQKDIAKVERIATERQADKTFAEKLRETRSPSLLDLDSQPQPKSISRVGPQEVYKGPLISLGGAFVESGKRGFQFLGEKFGPIGGETKVGSFGAIFDPFLFANPLKSERPTGIPRFGTIQEGQDSFVTYGELQKGIEFERFKDISTLRGASEGRVKTEFTKLQDQINKGDLTFEQATTQSKDILAKEQETFSGGAQQIFKDRPDIKGISERQSEFQQYAILGRDVALSSNPLTAFASAFQTYQEAPIVDVGGPDKIILERKHTAREAGFLAAGVVGVAFLGPKFEKELIAGRIESALEGQTKVGGFRAFKGDTIIDTTKALGYGDDAVAFSRTFATGKRAGEKGLVLASGGRETVVVTESYFAQKPIISLVGEKVTGTGQIFSITDDLSLTVGPGQTQKIFDISMVGGKTIGKFGGFKATSPELSAAISRQTDDVIKGFSGKATVKGQGFDFIPLGRGDSPLGVIGDPLAVKAGGKVSFSAEKAFSLKILRPSSGEGFTVIKGGGGRLTPLSKTFTEPAPLSEFLFKAPPEVSIVSTKPAVLLPKIKLGGGGGLFSGGQVVKETQVSTFSLGPIISDLTIQKDFSAPQVNLASFQGTKGLPAFGAVSQKPRLGSGQKLSPSLVQASIQPQELVSSLETLAPKGLITPPPSLTTPPFRGSFGFPFVFPIALPFGIAPQRKARRTGTRDFFRTPSFAAAELGLTAFKPGKYEFTGLVERPIISKKKKKKKK